MPDSMEKATKFKDTLCLRPPNSTADLVSPSRFLDLPKELRLMVYEQISTKVTHNNIAVRGQESAQLTLVYTTLPGIRILAVCRQIYHEARYIMLAKLASIEAKPFRLIANYQALRSETIHKIIFAEKRNSKKAKDIRDFNEHDYTMDATRPEGHMEPGRWRLSYTFAPTKVQIAVDESQQSPKRVLRNLIQFLSKYCVSFDDNLPTLKFILRPTKLADSPALKGIDSISNIGAFSPNIIDRMQSQKAAIACICKDITPEEWKECWEEGGG